MAAFLVPFHVGIVYIFLCASFVILLAKKIGEVGAACVFGAVLMVSTGVLSAWVDKKREEEQVRLAEEGGPLVDESADDANKYIGIPVRFIVVCSASLVLYALAGVPYVGGGALVLATGLTTYSLVYSTGPSYYFV